MTPEIPNAGEPASVYLDATLAERVRSAEKDLEGKGYSRSEILAESISEGLPAVVAKLKRRKAKISFADAFTQIVHSFTPDQEFTREDVITALKERYAAVVRSQADSVISANVSTYLRRLKDHGKVKLVGSREAPGPKAFRSYDVNVYQRVEVKKEST